MLTALLEKLVRHEDLTADEAAGAMDAVMEGRCPPASLAALLAALAMKGERPAEIVGFAQSMRRHSLRVAAAGEVFDTCGTGGDGSGTFNISSAAALVVAACGVTVAKHGNRSASSRCGSADVFEALGVNVSAPPAVAERTLRDARIAFLFAPIYHPSMKHAGPTRRELGIRTVFNLLGPLTNPAGASRQIVGVPRAALTEPMARALMMLGSTRAWVVHGADGVDELSTTGYTKVSECRDGAVHTFYVHPGDFGLPKSTLDALQGGDATENADIVRALLGGTRGPARDVVLLNAGAALLVAGRAGSVQEGIAAAAAAIDRGAATETLERLVHGSHAEAVGMNTAPDLLRTIVAATRRITEVRAAREPLRALEARAAQASPGGPRFEAALGRAGHINVIAECKRRSPSKGVLAAHYDPVAIARQYERGGAAAIAVLTEPTFFDGALAHLAAVRQAVGLPLLRKDFVVDDYQLFEARAAGADAVLLIVAALEPLELARLQARAWESGLAALVEVHDEAELATAVDSGARLIGVNNRNLHTLTVSLDASERIAARMPANVVAVSESGLQTRADIDRFSALGYRAFLIGERFMTDADPAAAIAALVGTRARRRRKAPGV